MLVVLGTRAGRELGGTGCVGRLRIELFFAGGVCCGFDNCLCSGC